MGILLHLELRGVTITPKIFVCDPTRQGGANTAHPPPCQANPRIFQLSLRKKWNRKKMQPFLMESFLAEIPTRKWSKMYATYFQRERSWNYREI